MGVIKDDEKALVPYRVKRHLRFQTHEGIQERTVNVDYGVLHLQHERIATVMHARILSRAIARHPQLRREIILAKHTVKKRRIDILHGGLTSAAVSFGIVRYGGRKQWLRQLINGLQKWVNNNMNEKYRPFLQDPYLPQRNLHGNIPAQAPVVRRIIYHLKGALEGRPTMEKMPNWIKINIPFPAQLKKLPQEIISMVKRAAKASWNDEYMRIHSTTSESQPFVTVFNNKVVVFLPPIPPRPKQKFYLPVQKIRDKKTAIKQFKEAHPKWNKDTKGYYYIRRAMSPDYNKIRTDTLQRLVG